MSKPGELMRMADAGIQAARAVREERERTAAELIEVLDSFDDALFAARRSPHDDQLRDTLVGWLEGLSLIPGKLTDILNRMGLEEIRVEPGDPLDPNKMDIFFIEFTGDEDRWGTVESVYRRGFRRDAKLWPEGPPVYRTPKVRVWGAYPDEPDA